MGAWGPAIFSDDTACDVRDAYRDLVGDGNSGAEATDILLTEWKESLSDPEEAPVFWLALAATQWKCGRLEERVKREALAVIDNGSDLSRWQDSHRERKKREGVLLKLREQLETPQPPEKRIPRRFRDSSDWQVGELIAYRLRSGLVTVFRVTGHHTDKGGTMPTCELLEWTGTSIPSERDLATLRVRPSSGNWDCSEFIIARTSERQLPTDRIQRLGIVQKPVRSTGGCYVFLWNTLDKQLIEIFGIE
jgi:hypothetical protein